MLDTTYFEDMDTQELRIARDYIDMLYREEKEREREEEKHHPRLRRTEKHKYAFRW